MKGSSRAARHPLQTAQESTGAEPNRYATFLAVLATWNAPKQIKPPTYH